MLTYEDFRTLVKELNSVESVTGKKYNDINVQDDFMYFRRENNEKTEKISIEEMYRFMCEQPIENITTSNAKYYIKGRVQSPAVAVIKKVYENGQANFEKQKLYKKIGQFVVFMALAIGIVLATLNNDNDNYFPVDAYNAPCVVNTNTIIVYDSENLDKVNDLIYNSDGVAINYLIGRGVCNYVTKGTKGVYVRYLRNQYVVVKLAGELRPAIIPLSHISRP